jgi:hypothetical protein
LESWISTRVKAQIPSHFRDTHPLFVALLEAYYEFVEQENEAVYSAKNLLDYRDIDTTLDSFLEHFYREFLSLIPRNTRVDRALLLKHARDFYRARGTEKSYKFLIRLLSNGNNDAEFYYPKTDILRASTSTWYIQKTLRLLSVTYDGEVITDAHLERFGFFEGLKITGIESGATAICERADHFYDNGYLVDEVTLSAINGTFYPGEVITAIYTDDNNDTHTLSGVVNPGIISSITVRVPGSGYEVGYEVPIEPRGNGSASGAIARISEVTTGSVNTISVIYGGSGYHAGDYLLFTSDSGNSANAFIASTDDDGFAHPNTYIIDISTISLEANTLIGANLYANLNNANANTALINAVNTFIFSNVGPAAFVTVSDPGSGYTTLPSISAVGNTRIQALGILGQIDVVDAGTNYAIGDQLTFTNQQLGHGYGAKAQVSGLVFGTNGVANVSYTALSGFPRGGVGYENDLLPTITISSVAGSGANLIVRNTLGFGATFAPAITDIGGIISIDVISGGLGYNVAPYINLTNAGSGTANAYANVNLGLYTYPGRYLSDTGHLSAFNFLQDRDYYQNHSYVIRVDESLATYRKAIESLLHPAGTKMFAEFIDIKDTIDSNITTSAPTETVTEFYYPTVLDFDGASGFGTAEGANVTNDMQTGIISFWMYPEVLPEQDRRIHIISFGSSNSAYIALYNTASQNSATGVGIKAHFSGPANSAISTFTSDVDAVPIYANSFYHVLISYSNDTRSKRMIYINDVECMGNISANVQSPNQFCKPNVFIGGTRTGTQMFTGALSEILVSNTWVDISSATVRGLFSANLVPLNLTSGILGNTAFVPIMYFRGNSVFSNVNSGAGNSFPFQLGTINTALVHPHFEIFDEIPYEATPDGAPIGSLNFAYIDSSGHYVLVL